MSIKVKRVYDEPEESDGYRILVDRLWPHGLSREEARIDLWLKDVAPSDELRRWFAHDPRKWGEFVCMYHGELGNKEDLARAVLSQAQKGNVTLLYAARDKGHNNAVALLDYITTNRLKLSRKAA